MKTEQEIREMKQRIISFTNNSQILAFDTQAKAIMRQTLEWVLEQRVVIYSEEQQI